MRRSPILYLWSFCHAKQARIEVGTKILWLSKVDGIYRCDLVFIVGEVLPIQEAFQRYGSKDAVLKEWHFRKGLVAHPHVKHTFVADMQHSYIPSPAVPLEDVVDEYRKRERAEAKPLHVVWRRPSGPLRIEAIDRTKLWGAVKCQ